MLDWNGNVGSSGQEEKLFNEINNQGELFCTGRMTCDNHVFFCEIGHYEIYQVFIDEEFNGDLDSYEIEEVFESEFDIETLEDLKLDAMDIALEIMIEDYIIPDTDDLCHDLDEDISLDEVADVLYDIIDDVEYDLGEDNLIQMLDSKEVRMILQCESVNIDNFGRLELVTSNGIIHPIHLYSDEQFDDNGNYGDDEYDEYNDDYGDEYDNDFNNGDNYASASGFGY